MSMRVKKQAKPSYRERGLCSSEQRVNNSIPTIFIIVLSILLLRFA